MLPCEELDISLKYRFCPKAIGILFVFERSAFPLLFVNGIAEVEDCLDSFVRGGSGIPTIGARIQSAVETCTSTCKGKTMLYGVRNTCSGQHPLNVGYILTRRQGSFVSCTEILKCHAFTDGLLFMVLPQGIRPESFCSPKKSFDIIVRIPLPEEKQTPISQATGPIPAPLGVTCTLAEEDCNSETDRGQHIGQFLHVGNSDGEAKQASRRDVLVGATLVDDDIVSEPNGRNALLILPVLLMTILMPLKALAPVPSLANLRLKRLFLASQK